MLSATFWSNTVWYILLGAVTVVEVVFVIIRAKAHRLVFAFYLTILGIVLSFETAVLIFMKAYVYYPMILKEPPFAFDAILAGNLFSQFSVAATALLVTIFDLGFQWFVFFALLYGIIEELFLMLGIYSHNWYQTWMTVIGLLLYFWLSKKIYGTIVKGVTPAVYYGYVFLGLFPLYVITIMWGFMVSVHLSFSTTLFSDPVNSRYFLCLAAYSVPAAVVMMAIYYLKLRWFWNAGAVIFLYGFYYVGCKLNLIVIREGWFMVVNTITMLWMYLSVMIMDKLYTSELNKFKKRQIA
jgi:hypothetical protein